MPPDRTNVITRRSALLGVGAAAAIGAVELAGTSTASAAPRRAASGQARRTGDPAPLTLPEVAAAEVAAQPFEHLLISRATYGWTPDLEWEVRSLGWEAWLDRQLAPSSIPDGAIDAVLAGYQTLTNSNQANHAIFDTDDGAYLLRRELSHSTFLRALHSSRQLHEVMVDFWTNHFNVFLYDSGYDHLTTVDNRTVARADALGKFGDLLSASAHSPAMLAFLSNALSNANSPDGVNENYGRELLELHTLGIIDGDHIYIEADVVGVAKVLSGWTINTAGNLDTFRFRPSWHHTGAVSLLNGQWSCPAHSAASGQQHGEDLLAFLARHESTARYICWKLVKRFVADDPPVSLVTSAKDVYLANDTAIAPVLRHIFHSAEFAASGGAKLRRGLEVLAATCRVTNAQVDPDPLGDAADGLHGEGWGALSSVGQLLWGHRNPDGYSDDGADWLSADGLLRRWEVCGAITHNWYEPHVVADPMDLVPNPPPPTAGRLLDAMAARLIGASNTPAPHGFDDIPAGAAYRPALDWAQATGVVTVPANGAFHPTDPVKRQHLVTMLFHAAGDPTGSPPHTFADVPATGTAGAALGWAQAEGVVVRGGSGRFRPKDSATRAEMATMAWRAAAAPTGSPAHGYTDVPANASYRRALDWARALGLLPLGTTFRPTSMAKRSQAVDLLFRRHFVPVTAITTTERTAIVAYLGGDEDQVTHDWFVEWKVPDLVGLILATPRFQHR